MKVNLLQGTYTPTLTPMPGVPQGYGADCLQRPLVPRSRFRQRLMPGVRFSRRLYGASNDRSVSVPLAGLRFPKLDREELREH